MTTAAKTDANIEQAVPGFWVHNIEESVRFYTDGLGFRMTSQCVQEGKLRWCRLDCRGAAVALWGEFVSRGLSAKRPFVGNGMWVTEIDDPDGYKLFFESPTDVAEDTVLADLEMES